LALFVLSAAAFLLSACYLEDLRWLKAVTWLFLGLATLHVIDQLLPISLLPRVLQGATGGLFWVWLTAIALSQAIFNRGLRFPVRVALAVLTLLVLVLGLLLRSSWASGWGPPLVAAVVVVVLAAPRLGWFLGLSGVALLAVNLNTLTSKVIEQESYSLMTRLQAWEIVTKLTSINPMLGLGPANYYYYTIQEPILGWYTQFNSHNNYVDIFAQTGILGLGLFLWFAWEMGWMGWRLLKRARQGFARAYVCGALGGLAGTLAAGMLGDWIIPFVYNIGLNGFRASVLGWIFLGGLSALSNSYSKTADFRHTPANNEGHLVPPRGVAKL
jgi:hypothetical protein